MIRDRYPEHNEEIVRLYDAGLSTRQIGRQIGWSANFVRNRLRSAGVQMRPRGGNKRPLSSRDAWATILLYDAMSMEEVARELGVTRSCVHRRLVAAGITRRPPGKAGSAMLRRVA